MIRYLPRNHGTETPSNLIFFDTECVETHIKAPEKTRALSLRLWAATKLRLVGDKVTRRRQAHGYDADSFWRFVSENSDRHRCTWIFAHNLAFDLTQVHFWSKLDDGSLTIAPLYRHTKGKKVKDVIAWRGRIVAERNPCYFIVRNGRRTYKFVDTCNYWPTTLSSIGERFGMVKVDLPSMDAPNREWLKRCRQDVAIIEEAILQLMRLWRKQDCGTFKVTAAAMSMANFQHVCPIRTDDGKAVDIVCRPGCETHALEREAYYGGRFQCYFVGTVKTKVYHVDCNSLYPFVMRNHDYPRRLAFFVGETTNEELAAFLPCYDCVARVLIKTRGQTFPVRIDGIQHHAYGEFFTSLCGPELQRALESNSIARIHQLQGYSRAALFRDWVDIWYSRKLTAARDRNKNAGDYEFAKLILNSLTGKWAQHGKRWEDVQYRLPLERWGGWPELNWHTGEWRRMRGLGTITQELTNDTEPLHSFPLISALITAYGREYMRSVIALCPDDSVYYMACDSIIGNADMLKTLSDNGLLSDTALGHFRLLGEYSQLRVRCANDYELDGIRTAGGLLGKSIAMGRTDGRVETWEGLPNLINAGPKTSVLVSDRRVMPGTPEYKGVINSAGWWNPYCLMDLQCWFADPPKGGYRQEYSSDTLADRIRLDA